MSCDLFRSTLAPHMRDFVAFKRLQGYNYTAQERMLTYFDRFLADSAFERSRLTAEIVAAYIRHIAHLGPNTRYSRFSVVRGFSRHIHLVIPDSYVAHEVPAKRPNLPRFYLYADAEVQALMQAARELRPTYPLRPHIHGTLIGLLAATGLRISEALSLDLADVRLDQKYLFVRKGKFAKERLLPLLDSTVHALASYLKRRLAWGLTDGSDPFFVNHVGKWLPYATARTTFRKLTQLCTIAPGAARPPRLHDLRHSYATKCLLRWYRMGLDVNAKLPFLATYMGHVAIESTQLYLHTCPELLDHANSRFQNAFPLQAH